MNAHTWFKTMASWGLFCGSMCMSGGWVESAVGNEMLSEVEMYEEIKEKLGDTTAKHLLDYVGGKSAPGVTVDMLDARLARLKSELLQYMLGFWATTIGLLVGILMKG